MNFLTYLAPVSSIGNWITSPQYRIQGGGRYPLAPPGAACQPCMFDIGSKIKLLMCIIIMLFGVFAHTCKNTSIFIKTNCFFTKHLLKAIQYKKRIKLWTSSLNSKPETVLLISALNFSYNSRMSRHMIDCVYCLRPVYTN